VHFFFIYLLLYAPHAKLGMIAGAGVATSLGLYWLWADFQDRSNKAEARWGWRYGVAFNSERLLSVAKAS
jgi:hypothetical protein